MIRRLANCHWQIQISIHSVKVLMSTRRTKLETSLQLHQFFRDVDHEESWIKEKNLLAGSKDYGG